jgi:S1-C subfamily serine protease
MGTLFTFLLVIIMILGVIRIIKNDSENIKTDKPGVSNPISKDNKLKKSSEKTNKNDESKIDLEKIEWNSNGSGILISKDGYIATNHHVISHESLKLKYIAVEFNHNDEIKSFKAKHVRSDVINDLAILKIDDHSFKNISKIPYSIKEEEADLGEEVFALGYPRALTIMGKDIKFTDGRISSKSGMQGDVTTYQSTTPLQPGNSGGPLFDYNGNLLGINVSKLGREVADNVSYTIKSSFLINLINVLPKKIKLPKSNILSTLSDTEKIKLLTKIVVLIKTKFE